MALMHLARDTAAMNPNRPSSNRPVYLKQEENFQLMPERVVAAIDDAVEKTKVGGATLTGLLGTSAWYAPGAASAALAEAICTDSKKMIPCCVCLDGEYGEKDLCIGVPVILGENGLEKIVEIELNEAEKAKFDESVAAARHTNSLLGDALK